MKEDFLHYIWKFKKFNITSLLSTNNETIDVISVGEHNYNSGPDFLNAKLRIGGQLWAGNVEIHLKSSDWYLHKHETDENYKNIILHIVWHDDAEIFLPNDQIVPTLVLKDYVHLGVLNSYKLLLSGIKQFINCEGSIGSVDEFVKDHWLERLYFKRLEDKTQWIEDTLRQTKGDWEGVLFVMLMRNFGLKVNKEAFESIAASINFSIVRKLRAKPFQLEALFFGLAGFMKLECSDAYFLELQETYRFIKHKFSFEENAVIPPMFYKLRPNNFPTIRLSQIASLYADRENLFSRLMEARDPEAIYALFNIKASGYWNTHYTFGKTCKESPKRITKTFVDLIIINTVIPLRFYYAASKGESDEKLILNLISSLKPERNTIVSNFKQLGIPVNNSMHSQALVELFNTYCSKNKCLHCAIGNRLIKQ